MELTASPPSEPASSEQEKHTEKAQQDRYRHTCLDRHITKQCTHDAAEAEDFPEFVSI